ncbi:MAG: orotidine-5'-phosphate decarboxylase [Deltaproteobacteria bacterium]|nr:orotidine-5'-phosphate decarboxylase [Deltaproteobacteria bacterium]
MAELIARPDSARQRIIVALDVADEEQLVGLVNKLLGQVGFVKIGKELFTALGPKAVELVINSGLKVFLDLKYHDIPNTVAGAVQAAARLGVDMLTVHASGGSSMLRAATAAAQESQKKPAIIAVTVLTSLSDPDLVDLGIKGSPEEVVQRLAGLALESGVDGLVNSPREVARLRSRFGKKPLLITPGVRPAGSAADDQTRIATPQRAVADGADYLVIGRPITKAADPAEAVARIVAEMESS